MFRVVHLAGSSVFALAYSIDNAPLMFMSAGSIIVAWFVAVIKGIIRDYTKA